MVGGGERGEHDERRGGNEGGKASLGDSSFLIEHQARIFGRDRDIFHVANRSRNRFVYLFGGEIIPSLRHLAIPNEMRFGPSLPNTS